MILIRRMMMDLPKRPCAMKGERHLTPSPADGSRAGNHASRRRGLWRHAAGRRDAVDTSIDLDLRRREVARGIGQTQYPERVAEQYRRARAASGIAPLHPGDGWGAGVSIKHSASDRIHVDPESEDFDIRNWPFFGIVQLAGRYHLKLDAMLKPIGMDVPRWRVLMIVSSQGPSSVTEISEIAVTKMSTMAKIIQRMTAQDLVSTRQSPDDARTTIVTITESGREVIQQIRKKVSRLSDRAFDGLSKSELELLNNIVSKIHYNLTF
ncbi:MarR family winged helix-turn-helix transcriptional regulator [Methylobacterium nonmethylotrophicum]|uniref:MarR family transcriptional regulator n=1 Tax=Methylobacterium nonmethylotrophicum TaxID=1141884 RepID=A0A4Z0NE20_9HYPH|nr:MarR family winged helix-turn-helix transcriptional regulator [Methylobacterium nonmethylotrophicum]TGD94270.1 MarR family transcriptional regulator [Methylobacterium nonmethylotrophicum]